jgi:GTP-binding protein EngB required for normal cell division
MTTDIGGSDRDGTSELTQPILDVCDDALRSLRPGRLRDDVAAVRFRLGEDGLRVAVAGRVSTGKSTLVNALLKRRVAPTAAGESTKAVTWFRYGVPARAEVVMNGGKIRELPLVGGRLPEELGTPLDELESVVVYLPDEVLKRLILIDTPGLSSIVEQRRDRTEALLAMHVATRTALAEADALVFLMSQTARQDDEKALVAFAEATRGVDASAVRTIGVLSKADKIAGGNLKQAGSLAEAFTVALHPKVATVVPVVALLGQTAEILTERDAKNLERLAALEPEDRDLAVSDVGLFRELGSSVPADERERLLQLLDLFGIAHCLNLIAAGRTGAARLAEGLRELSGISTLRQLLAETFERQAELLKAHAAVSALERIAWQRAESEATVVLESLRNDIERLRNRPQMHRLRELWAAEQAHPTAHATPVGGGGITARLQADLARVTSDASIPSRLGLDESASVDALKIAALAGASRWQEFKVEGATSHQEQQIAEVLVRSYTLIWSGLEGQTA